MNITLLETLLGALMFLGSSFLGVLIFIQNPRSSTNRIFFVLSILIDVYVVVNYISLHPPGHTPDSQLFWIRLVMFVTSFIGPSLILFVCTFPKERITLQFRYLVPLLLLMLASGTVSLLPLVFTGIEYPAGEAIPVAGPGIPIFFLDFLGLFLLSFIILIYKHRRSFGVARTKYFYLASGVIISFSLTGFFTVFAVVILQTSKFVFLGPISPMILLIFIGYAMVKYSLFDVSIFAAKALTPTLWIILFAKIFVAQSVEEAAIDIFVFLAAVVLGIFLVWSVQKEIRQREELEQISKQLAEANEELLSLDRAKSEFISIASHQLRAPLTVIKGYLSLVVEGTLGKIPKKAVEAVRRSSTATEQLVRLVSSLLNLSRIEAGKIEYDFRPSNLMVILRELLEELRPHAAQKSLSLHLECEEDIPLFLFDRDKMREVIINLLDNAIKYTPAGTVFVRVQTIIKERKSFVRISVKDQGIGVRKEDAMQLFKKFARADEAKTIDPNGLGLGLFIVKRIVEDHGGSVWVESKGIGKGSTFYIDVPLNEDESRIMNHESWINAAEKSRAIKA